MADMTSLEKSEPSATSTSQDWAAELRARERERRLQAGVVHLGGVKAFEDYTFDKFDPDLNGTHKILEVVRRFDLRKQNLFLIGPVGTGKTHLSVAKAHEVFDKGGRVRVLSKEALNEFLSEDRKHRLEELRDLDCVVLDDIEDRPNSELLRGAIKYLLDQKDAWRKFGMVITSNKPLDVLEKILGPKITDRMDGNFLFLVIPETTPSVRGMLKRRARNSAKTRLGNNEEIG